MLFRSLQSASSAHVVSLANKRRDANANAQGVGDGRAGEAPAVLGAEHRDGLAAARAAVADELGLVEHDAEPPDLRERPAVRDMSMSISFLWMATEGGRLGAHPCLRSQAISSSGSMSEGMSKSRLSVWYVVITICAPQESAPWHLVAQSK